MADIKFLSKNDILKAFEDAIKSKARYLVCIRDGNCHSLSMSIIEASSIPFQLEAFLSGTASYESTLALFGADVLEEGMQVYRSLSLSIHDSLKG